MSKVLLTIGYTTLLLPSDRGLATILNAQRDAVKVESDKSYLTDPLVEIGDEVSIEVKTLPRRCKVTTRTDDGAEVACEELSKAGRTKAKKQRALGAPAQQLLLGGPR